MLEDRRRPSAGCRRTVVDASHRPNDERRLLRHEGRPLSAAGRDCLLHHGSSSGEAWLFVPAALLAGLSHVWFAGNFADKDGHQEWLVKSVIAEPPAAWLLALGLLGCRRGVRSPCHVGRGLA